MNQLELTEKQTKRYNRILSHTEELLYTVGYNKLSLTEITNHLRISRSTIYEYFGSKEALVEEVVKLISQRLNGGLEEVVQDGTLTTSEKFIHLAQVQSQNLNANCFRLLQDLKIYLPHLYQQFEEGRKQREANGYKTLIEQGDSEGLFDPSLPQDFLLELYLKMGQLLSDTNITNNISYNKSEAMQSIIKVFLSGTKHFNA